MQIDCVFALLFVTFYHLSSSFQGQKVNKRQLAAWQCYVHFLLTSRYSYIPIIIIYYTVIIHRKHIAERRQNERSERDVQRVWSGSRQSPVESRWRC